MSLLDAMRAASGAENWEPTPGDGLEGELLAIDPNRSSTYTPRYTALTLRTTGGVYIVHAYHSVLADEVSKALREGLQTGDTLAVVYTGKKPPKSRTGKPFHHFAVAWQPHGPRSAPTGMPDLPEDPF